LQKANQKLYRQVKKLMAAFGVLNESKAEQVCGSALQEKGYFGSGN